MEFFKLVSNFLEIEYFSLLTFFNKILVFILTYIIIVLAFENFLPN
jgi:hypothetical protein